MWKSVPTELNSVGTFFYNCIAIVNYEGAGVELKFKRILLKLSGESLMGEKGYGIDPEMLNHFSGEIGVRALARC